MKISEGVKTLPHKRHTATEIPDCGRDQLVDYFKELGFTTGVEIGCFTANFTQVLAKSGMKIYTVDPWLAYEDYPYYDKPQSQKKVDKQYEYSKNILSPYKNVTIIRKTSMDAVKDFKKDSIDFVYIDGNHSMKYVIEDIWEWTKIVKPGGIISGHDYIYARHTNFHVRYCVDMYAEVFAKKYWVLGSKIPKKGTIRDQWRSWFWFKTKYEHRGNILYR